MSLSSAPFPTRAARPPERGETGRYSPGPSPSKGFRGREGGFPHLPPSSRAPYMTDTPHSSANYSTAGHVRPHGPPSVDSVRHSRGPFDAMHQSPGGWRAWGGPYAPVGGRAGSRHQDTSAPEYCDFSARAAGGGSGARRAVQPRSREEEDYYYHKGDKEKESMMRPAPVAASGRRSISPPASHAAGRGGGGGGGCSVPQERWSQGGRGSCRGGGSGGTAPGAPGVGSSGGNTMSDFYRREGSNNQTRNGGFLRGRGGSGVEDVQPRRHYYGDEDYMRAATSASPRGDDREKRANASYGYSGSRDGRERQQGSTWAADRGGGGGGRSPGAGGRRRECSPDYSADAPGSRRDRGHDMYSSDTSPRYRGGRRREEFSPPPARGAYNGRSTRGGGTPATGAVGQSSCNSSRVEGKGDSQERTRRFSLVARGVNPAATPEELKSFFAECVEVKDVYIPLHYKTKQPRGFGFVEFHTRAAMEKALSLMQGEEFLGRRLHLEEAAGEPSTAEEMRRRFQMRRQQWRADSGRGGGGGGSYRGSTRGDWQQQRPSRGGGNYRERGPSRSPDRRKNAMQDYRGGGSDYYYYHSNTRDRRDEESLHGRRDDDEYAEGTHGRRRDDDMGKMPRRNEYRAASPSYERGRRRISSSRDRGGRSTSRGYGSGQKRSRSLSSGGGEEAYSSRRYREDRRSGSPGAVAEVGPECEERGESAARKSDTRGSAGRETAFGEEKEMHDREDRRRGSGGRDRDTDSVGDAKGTAVSETAGLEGRGGTTTRERDGDKYAAAGGKNDYSGDAASTSQRTSERERGSYSSSSAEYQERGGSSRRSSSHGGTQPPGAARGGVGGGASATESVSGKAAGVERKRDSADGGAAERRGSAGMTGGHGKYADTTTSTAAPAETPSAAGVSSSDPHVGSSCSGSPGQAGAAGGGGATAESSAASHVKTAQAAATEGAAQGVV